MFYFIDKKGLSALSLQFDRSNGQNGEGMYNEQYKISKFLY